MTTTVVKAGAVRTPRTAAAPARRYTLTFAAIVVAFAAASLGTWLAVDRLAGTDASAASASMSAPAWTPGPIDVVQLKRQLVRVGYSIRVDGSLDPVAKSALADFLQFDSAHPLGQSLGVALEGTVITGRRDPQAWNSRFGLDRGTQFVERPLTGPGGQLDVHGNLRSP